MKFEYSALNNDLKIIIVARNLTSLFYPFIEAIYSTIPLGCDYIIGNCQSQDDTADVLRRMSKYVPIQIIDIPWRAETGGTAIGIAIQAVLDAAPTFHVLSLQACEILCDDGVAAIKKIFAIAPQMMVFDFHHFWGNFNFDGSLEGRGYASAYRVLNKNQVMNMGDGCSPQYPPGDAVKLGTIHRYSYCFDNQVDVKAVNHYRLYHGDAQSPQTRRDSVEWCKRNPNYYGPHPQCVEHLRGRSNYDVEYSLRWFESQFQ